MSSEIISNNMSTETKTQEIEEIDEIDKLLSEIQALSIDSDIAKSAETLNESNDEFSEISIDNYK